MKCVDYCIDRNFGWGLILASLVVGIDWAKSKHSQIIFGYQHRLSQVANCHLWQLPLILKYPNCANLWLHLFKTKFYIILWHGQYYQLNKTVQYVECE